MYTCLSTGFSAYYDKAVIKFEHPSLSETLYLPLVLKGRPGISGMRRQHDVTRVRKQQDKHWFRVTDDSFKFLYSFSELEELYKFNYRLEENATKNGRAMSSEDFTAWMLSEQDYALSIESHALLGNTLRLGKIIPMGTETSYITTTQMFFDKIPVFYTSDVQLFFHDVKFNRPSKGGINIFTIDVPKYGYFQKYTSTKIRFSRSVKNCKHFSSEKELMDFVDKTSYKFFCDHGFEIVEYTIENDDFKKVEF